MLDGALRDSEGCWSSSKEVALVKRLILCDDLYVDINQASEMTCRSPEFFTAFFLLNLLWQRGHLLNLSYQLRRNFSLHRPLEGGYEPPLEFSWLLIAKWVTLSSFKHS